ncbi:hypothetical protein LZ32DRAFT_401623 [Colletotrichum eremochloae]|nr:hypothetical protein LZ32DRAFT_401623 [Colletotrichum eremochloae]
MGSHRSAIFCPLGIILILCFDNFCFPCNRSPLTLGAALRPSTLEARALSLINYVLYLSVQRPFRNAYTFERIDILQRFIPQYIGTSF